MGKRLFFLVGLMLFFCSGAWALELGTNITMFDGIGTGTGWYGAQEDNEVEPGNVAIQVWDLEGFFLNGSTLAMVGGYDFVNGESNLKSGDIFIDVDDSFAYGTENANSGGSSSTPVVNNSFGYDYVLDMNFAAKTYSVIRLGASSSVVQTELVYYSQNAESNPWLYYAGGTLIDGLQDVPMGYFNDLTDSETGLTGGLHNAVFVDLTFLGHGTEFTAHFTMECGNDNLMGHSVTPAPEPGTLALVGAGLLGLLAWRRRS